MADPYPAPEAVPPRELLVFRHGHAVPHGSVEPDFERPLDARGAADVAWMAGWAVEAGAVPDFVVASPARRTRQTAEGFCRGAGLDPAAIRWERRIYDAHLSDLLAVLADAPSTSRRVMLVGHNPGLERISGLLGHPEGRPVRLATAAAVRLRMPEDWSGLSPGDGGLLDLVRPPRS